MNGSNNRKINFMRLPALMILLLALSASFAGCKRIVEPENKSISVYATFWPIYAMTDAAMEGIPDAELKLLVQPQDGCLRNYQLSDWDAALLSADADAIIMGGRGLESFEGLLFGWGESGPAVTAVLYNIDLYNQDDVVNDEAETHLRGPNPHLYMSIEGAKKIIESVSASLLSLDPQYAEKYAGNAENAARRLDALLKENRELLSDYEGRSVILMNEALIYVADDYGLRPVAWIDRESGENLVDTELDRCLEQLEASGARVILIEKQAPQPLIQALEAKGYAVAKLDVFSTRQAGEGFDAYIEAQSANARAISEAFAQVEAWEDED